MSTAAFRPASLYLTRRLYIAIAEQPVEDANGLSCRAADSVPALFSTPLASICRKAYNHIYQVQFKLRLQAAPDMIRLIRKQLTC